MRPGARGRSVSISAAASIDPATSPSRSSIRARNAAFCAGVASSPWNFGSRPLPHDLAAEHLGPEQLAEFKHRGIWFVERRCIQHPVRLFGFPGDQEEFSQQPARIGIGWSGLYRSSGCCNGARNVTGLEGIACFAHFVFPRWFQAADCRGANSVTKRKDAPTSSS